MVHNRMCKPLHTGAFLLLYCTHHSNWAPNTRRILGTNLDGLITAFILSTLGSVPYEISLSLQDILGASRLKISRGTRLGASHLTNLSHELHTSQFRSREKTMQIKPWYLPVKHDTEFTIAVSFISMFPLLIRP